MEKLKNSLIRLKKEKVQNGLSLFKHEKNIRVEWVLKKLLWHIKPNFDEVNVEASVKEINLIADTILGLNSFKKDHPYIANILLRYEILSMSDFNSKEGIAIIADVLSKNFDQKGNLRYFKKINYKRLRKKSLDLARIRNGIDDLLERDDGDIILKDMRLHLKSINFFNRWKERKPEYFQVINSAEINLLKRSKQSTKEIYNMPLLRKMTNRCFFFQEKHPCKTHDENYNNFKQLKSMNYERKIN